PTQEREMQSRFRLSILLCAALVAACGAVALANPHAPRQYYGGWEKKTKHKQSYRPYHYKPSPHLARYRHHYLVYSRKRPGHYYFYNPYKKQYWGRCPVGSNGKALYSKLADKDMKENLEEIPESAFPEPGKPPTLPEATDDATLELPPDDLPGGDLA